MHDVAAFEKQGLPSVALLTNQFLDQSTYQAQKLGLERIPRIAIQHPVVDPSCSLDVKAERAFMDVVRALTSHDVPIPELPSGTETVAQSVPPADCGT